MKLLIKRQHSSGISLKDSRHSCSYVNHVLNTYSSKVCSYLVAKEVIDKLSSTVLRASAYLLGAFVAVHHFHMERSAFPGKAADRRHRHCDSAVVAG